MSGAGTARAIRNVTIPLGSFHLSGGVKVLVLLANGIAARGVQVRFLAPAYGTDCPFELDPNVSVQVVSCGPRFLPKPVRQILYYLKLSVISARETDLCLANYYLTAYGAFFSRLLQRNKPELLWYVQGYEAGSHGLLAEAGILSRFFRYHLARASYRLPVRIFCVSNWVREQIGRPDAEVVHPPALNLAVFTPVQRRENGDGTLVIGTIGRRGKTKGYDDFIRAVRSLSSDNIRLLVASPTAGEVVLPHEVPAEAVHAVSEEQMAAFYRRCDIFVLPSRMEGFPLPPLEAMACGCAVVAADCGGVSEYARDGENCLTVPAAEPERLAEAIRRLCRDASLRAALAQEGIRCSKRYDRQGLADAFLDRIPLSRSSQRLAVVVK